MLIYLLSIYIIISIVACAGMLAENDGALDFGFSTNLFFLFIYILIFPLVLTTYLVDIYEKVKNLPLDKRP